MKIKKRFTIVLLMLITATIVLYFSIFKKYNSHFLKSKIERLELVIADSIPFFNDSLSFRFVNLQKIQSDTILAFQYPILNLSLLDSKGNFIKEVSRKGDLKEQFRSQFINTYFAADGNLYVLEEGNAPRLCIFDRQFNYLKSFNLTDKIGNHYIPPITSNFYIDFLDTSYKSFLLYVNIGSILFHRSSKKLYQEDSSFATLLIKDGQVQNASFNVALKNFNAVKKGLKSDKKKWDSPDPIFKIHNGLFYVKYEFDDSVYVFNKNWQQIKSYAISSSFTFDEYSTPFEPIKDINKSVESAFKFRYSNKYYYSMDVYENKIFLLYYHPVNSKDVPTNENQENKFLPKVMLHVFDMKDLKEFSCEIPKFISPYSKIIAKNETEFYLLGNTKVQEDIWIYTFRIK